jgi:hypothetical protein
MEKNKNYQSPRIEVHRLSVDVHMLNDSLHGGPSANFMSNPGVRRSSSVSTGPEDEIE